MSAKRRAKRSSARRDLLPAPSAEAAAVRAAHLANSPLVVAEGEEARLHQETLQPVRHPASNRRVTVNRPGPAGFHTALALHFHCRRIRRSDDPYAREVGFCCSCGGTERQWNVPLTELRQYDPSVRDALDMLRHADTWENFAARQEVNVESMAAMGIEVANHVRRWRRMQAREEKDRERARKKARALLRQNVTRAQWGEFRKSKEFHVVGTDGQVYRISHQIGSNVTLVVNGVDVARFCVVPKEHAWIPEPDMMLAVKLMLETNARSFLRKANRIELRPTG